METNRYSHTVILRKSTPEEYRLAELMGLKTKRGMYKSVDGVNKTLFTSPPEFCKGTTWITYLKQWAKDKGIELASTNNSEELVKELISKLE